MSELLSEQQPTTAKTSAGPRPARVRVGVVEGALEANHAILQSQFPGVDFTPAEAAWSSATCADCNLLIVPADMSGIDGVVSRLAGASTQRPIVVALRDADVSTTRRLLDAGAADVLPSPISEAALAACLTRLLHTETRNAGSGPSGQLVAFLKAGGGVGATSLACQAAFHLAEQGRQSVCLADLDLEFGIADLFFDAQQAISVSDLLASGSPLGETSLAQALSTHPSGARLLAPPRQLTPLETLTQSHADALANSLRRDFELTLIDLPSVWTAWTNQVLSRVDRIVLVTKLSVPHVQLVKRQLQTIASQQLEGRPLILVCNAVSSEQRASVSVKTAEKALGRPFDLVIPEDQRLMFEAANRGQPLASVGAGRSVRGAVGKLAQLVAGAELAAPVHHHWIW